jgi:hypothetical protein
LFWSLWFVVLGIFCHLQDLPMERRGLLKARAHMDVSIPKSA